MLKLLVVFGVIYIVYRFFIKQNSIQKPEKKAKTTEDIEEMVACASCGVYVELKEAILSNGKYYCSDKCLKN